MKKLLLLLITILPGYLYAQVSIKGVPYEQLTDAIAAAQSGDTVEIAGPVMLNSQVGLAHASGAITFLGVTDDASIKLADGSRFILEAAGETIFIDLTVIGADQANADWGAMFTLFNGPTLTLRNDTIRGAKTDAHAGAIRVTNDATVKAYNTVFRDNQANQNGGVAFIDGSNTETLFDGCVFINNLCGSNSVDAKGGALFYASNNNGRGHTIKNSAFIENKSNNHGGAIGMERNSPVFANCTFSGNMAKDNGGAVWMWNADGDVRTETTTTLVNCTFVGNSVELGIGSVLFGNQAESKFDVMNSVFHENGEVYIAFAEPAAIAIQHSYFPVIDNPDLTINGTNNLNEGELFLGEIDTEAGIVYYDVTDDASVLVGLGKGSLLKPHSRFDQIGKERDVNGDITAGSIERVVAGPVLSAETKTRFQLSVFPNPTSDYIIVNAPSNGKISLYNMNGMLMMTRTVKTGQNKIDISSLPKSVYTIQSRSTKGTQLSRLVKR